MDIYETNELNRLVDSLFRPQTALLSAFFPEIQTSEEETIYFDVNNKKRRLSPFVSPLREGKLVEDEGFTTNSFKPAYIKDKRLHDPNKAVRRMAGETIGGSMTNMDRHMANLALSSADQLEMLTRRKEVMAAEVLLTGKATITGEGYPTTVVDFGRAAGNRKALTTTARWGESGVKPLADVKAWRAGLLKDHGVRANDVIMTADAWELFLADAEVVKYLDTRPLSPTTDAVKTVNFIELGLDYQGKIGQVRYWVYSDWYTDDNGTTQPVLADYSVILASQDLDGVQHHGAIKDLDAGIQAREYFSKSWTVQDPSSRILLMQSAPLIVPYRPNASLGATVR
jgi:hypothetical protein